MKSSIAAAVAIAALVACTTIEPSQLGGDVSAQLRGQNVAIVIQEPTPFGMMTHHDLALGPPGFALMGEQGEALRQAAHIEDPAEDIATSLADVLAGRHGAVILPEHGRARDEAVRTSIAAAPAGARYVLAVGTLSWAIMRIPLPRQPYQVNYLARARLIDVRTQAVIAEGGCLQIPDGTELASTDLSLFTVDNAALTKRELAARVDRCLHFIKRDMLGV